MGGFSGEGSTHYRLGLGLSRLGCSSAVNTLQFMSWKYNPLNPGYWAQEAKNPLPGSQFVSETYNAYKTLLKNKRKMSFNPKGGIDWAGSAALTAGGAVAAGRALRNAWRFGGAVNRGVRSSRTAANRQRRGRVVRALHPGRTVRVGRGRKRRRRVGRGRRRKGSRKGRFMSGNKTALPAGKWNLKYKVNSLFAYSPRRTENIEPLNEKYYLPRIYINAFAAHYPLAAWTGCIAVPNSSVGAFKSQPAGWDVLAKRYLKYFCYGSTLNFAVLNPSAADAEVLEIGTDNLDSSWHRIYDTTDEPTMWPLPSDPEDPGQVIGAWTAPVARTSKISFFKSRRTARMTEFGEGSSREDVESLMFEGDTLIDEPVNRQDITNEELAYSRMSAYCQQVLIPPRKQRQLSGVKTLDLTGTQETRMFGSMSVKTNFLPRNRVKIYKKMRRALSNITAGSEEAATGLGPWRLTSDLGLGGAAVAPAEPDRNWGVYVLQFDDLAQVAIAEWNLIELAIDVTYKCKFWGDKTKPIDQHRRYVEVANPDSDWGISQEVHNSFLHNLIWNQATNSTDPHTFGPGIYRSFQTGWPNNEFSSIEDWIQSY